MTRRERVRLSRRHQVWIYASFGALFASGLAWIAAQLWLADGGGFGESPSAWVPWSMKLHGAAAMVVLVVIGTVIPGHARRAWNANKGRRTGASLVAWNALLIASGYALYYAGGEHVRAIASPLHWMAGLTLPALFAWHVWEGKSTRAKKTRWRKHRGHRGRRHKSDAAEPVSIPTPNPQLHRAITD